MTNILVKIKSYPPNLLKIGSYMFGGYNNLLEFAFLLHNVIKNVW